STGTFVCWGSHPVFVPLEEWLVRRGSCCAPPSACIYLLKISSGERPPPPGRISTVFTSSAGGLYCTERFGTTVGRRSPRWQVQQVTERTPEKLSLLRAFTISNILREVCFIVVSAANRSQLLSLSPVWQSRQFKPTAAEIIPIVSMNSSTGIPLRTCTFLKTFSAICGLGSCPA